MVLVRLDGSLGRVGPVVTRGGKLEIQFGHVQVFSVEVGDFVVTADIFSPESVVQEFLVACLESSEEFPGVSGLDGYGIDEIGIIIVE